MTEVIEINTNEAIGNISCPDPSETNPLQLTGFLLTIAKIPNITYWCKSVTIPSYTSPEAIQETPLSPVYWPGTRPEMSTLNITFTIDAGMENYEAVANWLTLISTAQSMDDIKKWKNTVLEHFIKEHGKDPSSPNLTSDGSLIVYGAGNVPVRALTFKELFPISLDGFEITEDTSEVVHVAANASFRFTGTPSIGNRLS